MRSADPHRLHLLHRKLCGLGAWWVLLVVAACTPVRKGVQGDLVRRIRFEGNGGAFSGQNGYQLRQVLEQQASPPLTFTWPFMYFSDPVQLATPTLTADAKRLEVYYAHHGWFDAVMSGWEIRRVRAQSEKRAGVVDLIGHIDPGARSVVRHVTIDASGDKKQAQGLVLSLVKRLLPIKAGDPFSLDDVQAAKALFVQSLQNAGYAYAQVDVQAVADPEQQIVDISFHVDAGPLARFGAVEVYGIERVKEQEVRDVLGLSPGSPYMLASLQNAQRRLFDTGMFAVVNIDPDLSDRAVRSVPIRVEVTEAKFRKIRIGAGLQFDYYTLQPRLTLSFEDKRLGASALQLRIDGGAGAVVGVVSDSIDRGLPVLPTGAAGFSLSDPWLLHAKLSVDLTGRFQQDAQFGTLPFRKYSAGFLTTYHFTPKILLSAGPVVEAFSYLQPSRETLAAAKLQFGGDFQGDTYRLLSIDTNFTVDWRDDPLSPARGFYGNLGVRQSIPIPVAQLDGSRESGFLYTKIDGDLRGYKRLVMPKANGQFFVFAGRLHGTLLVPWQAGGKLPYPDLAFLGGPNSLRSFRTNQVGPYDCICSYRNGRPDPQHNNGLPYNLTRTYLPRGGALSLEAEGEARYDWRFGLSFAVFGEVGLLTRELTQIAASDLRYGGGFGVRYRSPVGPIRLDVGLRPNFPEDFGAASYINCNPFDELARGFDVFSAGYARRMALPNREIPLALNIMFAIGEAF